MINLEKNCRNSSLFWPRNFQNWPIKHSEDSSLIRYHEHSCLVYLTGDSPNLLTSFDPKYSPLNSRATYIIGGFVDHNSQKNLTLSKANKLSIQTARFDFPDDYLISTSLNVNTCFAILIDMHSGLSCTEAAAWRIPSRKRKTPHLKDGK